MTHREIVAREGWPFVAFTISLTVALYLTVSYIGLAVGLVLTIFCVYFFRNPERSIAGQKGDIVSPADGRVMDVKTVVEENYVHAKTIRVRIFLSIFNVHINRSPIEGRVEWVNRVSGIYLPAYKDEVSDRNARNYLGIVTDWGKILVVQITGLIARRLVCWVQPGDTLKIGERFGLIRFGSCTEIYLPEDAIILVQPGQKLKGGETVIARFCE
ncbi:MAG: phosphatidylserine decarboxylase family protein [Firmicutes bacterium HGW-Firmicutes-15]|nr:MAG: phosphatidylserine decarboxylase family protein [Firmicutes bacterium HGW-Firmicutes-15]